MNELELQRYRGRLAYWAKKEGHYEPDGRAKWDILNTTLHTTALPILNTADVRHGEELTTLLYMRGTLGKLMGLTTQSIQLLEENGTIPPTNIQIVGDGGSVRNGYTAEQVLVFMELLPLLNFSDRRGSMYTKFSRELWRRWGEMPDGVGVIPKPGATPADYVNRGPRKVVTG